MRAVLQVSPQVSLSAVSRVRPLLVRPGARFRCAGDGLCCTDLHALGPLTRVEARDMRKLVAGSVQYHPDVEAPCMRFGKDGGCAQLQRGMCGVHARYGAQAKPVGCRRFPYGLLGTPEGGRVTTEHRCPCRTLGERPPIDLRDAEASLKDPAGRLYADESAPLRMPMAARRRASFAHYRAIEARMLEQLQRGERAERVLGEGPLPRLSERSWPVFAAELMDMNDGSRGSEALRWFGDALLALSAGHKPPSRERPWRAAFERGAKRTRRPEAADRVINDWVGDELWMMRWLTWDCAFDTARAELATRVHAVRWLTRRIARGGVREDQAAAEAVMMAELAACSEVWDEVVGAIG
jgi:hypothetical protein